MAVFVELPCGNHHTVQWLYNFDGHFLWKTRNFGHSFANSKKMTSSVSEQVQTLQVQLFPVCTLPDRGILTRFSHFDLDKKKMETTFEHFVSRFHSVCEKWIPKAPPNTFTANSVGLIQSEHVQYYRKQLTITHNRNVLSNQVRVERKLLLFCFRWILWIRNERLLLYYRSRAKMKCVSKF